MAIRRALETRIALLVVRVTLGVFLLLRSVGKSVTPNVTILIFARFDEIVLPSAIPPGTGVAEVALILVVLARFWRRLIYGFAVVVHGISTLAPRRQVLAPFGRTNVHDPLYIAAVPVLGAPVAP